MKRRIYNRIKQEYFDFLRPLQNRDITGMENLHKHHIYPKSLFPSIAESKYNLVMLTIAEHTEAHKMLAEMTNERGMLIAYYMMSGHNIEDNAEWVSEETKKKIAESLKGRIFTESHRKNLSKNTKGKKRTLEQRKTASSAQKKRFENPVERKKNSDSHKGQMPWNKGVDYIAVQGEKSPNAKITEQTARQIKIDIAAGMRECDIIRKNGVTRKIVTHIKDETAWKWLQIKEAV